jgi:hypothetical protein
MIIRDSPKIARASASLELARARLARAIQAVVDEPACAAEWTWITQEVVAREIGRNPDKTEQLTLRAAKGWERHINKRRMN